MAGIVTREQLTDDTVLVFISDTHIGGTGEATSSRPLAS